MTCKASEMGSCWLIPADGSGKIECFGTEEEKRECPFWGWHPNPNLEAQE